MTARSGLYLPSSRGLPLATTLPAGAEALYWGADGAPAQALRVLAAHGAHPALRVEAAEPLVESAALAAAATSALRKTSSGHILGALQAEGAAEASTAMAAADASRRVIAAAVDWRSSRAYVALSAGGARGGCPLMQLALPSLVTLAVVSPPSVQPDSYVSAMAIGGGASETTAPPSWLYVLRSSHEGKMTELLGVRLPELQATHAISFATPSPVIAAHFDARAAWLYLLCTAPAPRLLRIQMRGGEPAGPPGFTDTLPLPSWGASAPLLVPFPRSRQLVFFSAPSPTPAAAVDSASSPPLLRLCRVRMGAPPPLDADGGGCTQLRGQHSVEQITAAVADEVAAVAYLGCRSGKVLRLRLFPLRVEETLRPLGSMAIAAAVFRPDDGALWLAAESGELVQLSTRLAQPDAGRDEAVPPPAPPPAWFRWKAAAVVARPRELALLPPPPPPQPPPPPRPPPSFTPAAASRSLSAYSVYRRLGAMPTIILSLIGAFVGSMIGSRLYRLCRACVGSKREVDGLRELP